MLTADFDYDLPPELVAQTPPARREDARLLCLDRRTGSITHGVVPDLLHRLRPGDLLIANETRVLPARLFGHRATGGKVEFLLLPAARVDEGSEACEALGKCGGTLLAGEEVTLAGGGVVRVDQRLGGGRFVVSAPGETLAGLMQRVGKMPLPPYIRRRRDDPRDDLDRERYQTVFAREPGAAAAPTAGLHLGTGLLAQIDALGVTRAFVTLHVGVGTFRPITAHRIDAHTMHAEWFSVPQATVAAVAAARARGGRIVAVGTTTVRALETAAADGHPTPGTGLSRLFITPGYRFRVVDALLTNFHLPRSTLLCLVSAFASRDAVMAAYAEAVTRRYRFYSYGDAMFLG